MERKTRGRQARKSSVMPLKCDSAGTLKSQKLEDSSQIAKQVEKGCSCGKACASEARKLLKMRMCKAGGDFFLREAMDEQYRQLTSIFRQSVFYGESNSVLVIGPRGSGKSKLVQACLSEVSAESDGNFFYVFLSGMVHTDDKSALQDMARQLELENVIGDRVFGSFAENLAFILDSLKGDTGSAKSVVVVLDEFDWFHAHKNQALLYNLFDVAQSRQTPLCVVGLTCRLDVVELLEKRVKSRYSHRAILLFPTYAFDLYKEFARKYISLPDSCGCSAYRKSWQAHVQSLLADDRADKVLMQLFDIRKDLGAAVKLLTSAVSELSPCHPFVTAGDLETAYSSLTADSKAALLQGLSILELCLVIAAKHVAERRQGQPFNFEMLFGEYQNFLKNKPVGISNYDKAVTFKAYEHLLALELIRSAEGPSQSNTMKEFRLMTMMVDSSQITEALQRYADCPTELRNWGQSMFA